MKRYNLNKTAVSILILISFLSCNKISSQRVSANDFYSELIDDNSSIIIDVRTPEEFSKGHLRNALNINWLMIILRIRSKF